MNDYLGIKWTVSRARDTYGWNVCTLTDTRGRKVRCNGGGYDMIGTVVGDWLQDCKQSELLTIHERAGHFYRNGSFESRNESGSGLYGMTYLQNDDDASGRVVIDGAAGIESVRRIARAIGLEISGVYQQSGRKRGETLGFTVSAVETAGA